MPYAIRLPDGALVQNIPDEVTPEEAKRRIIAAGIYKPPVPETTLGGQAKELVKGLIPGAVGLVEQAAIGASALLPEEAEKAAREKIASVAGAIKAPFAAAPGYEESVGRKLSEAIGSTAPFLVAGPLGLAGRAAAVGLGVGAGAGEARTRAEREGATEEQRGTATALGVIPGAMEVFAPFRILSRVPEAATATGVQAVKRAFMAGGEEAAQEAASNFAQNLIAKGVYKPEQELIEGLGESAAYGGATGAIVQGLMDLALGRRARGAQPATAAPAGEKPIDVAARRAAEAQPAAEAPAPAEPAPEVAPEPAPAVAEAPVATTEPPVPAGYVRVYHSGSKGEGDSGRWVSTQKSYAAGYRPDLPLFYTDIRADDPRVNNPDYPEYNVSKGFTFNFELTPEEATTLKEVPRVESVAPEAEAPVEPAPEVAPEPAPAAVEPTSPYASAEAPAEPVAPAPVAEAVAPEPVPEPKVRKVGEPLPLPEVLDASTVAKIGFSRGSVHNMLVGKAPSDPEVRDVLQTYLDANREAGSLNPKTEAKINAFLARLPEPTPLAAEAAPTPPTAATTEIPSVPVAAAIEPTGGAGVAVAGEPAAGTAPGGAGVSEPTRMVPPVADVADTAGREGQQPAAVEPAAKPAPRNAYEPPLKEGLTSKREADLRAKLAQQRKEIATLEEVRDKAESNIDLAGMTGNEEVKARAIDAHEAARLVLKKATAAADRTYAQLFDLEKADFEGAIGEAYVADLRAERDARLEAAKAKNSREAQGLYPFNLTSAEAVREELRDQASHLPGYKELVEKYFTSDNKLRKGKTEEQFVAEGQGFLDKSVLYRTIPQSPLVQNRISHTELEKVVDSVGKALGGKASVTILDDVTDVDVKEKPGTRAGALIKGEIYLFRSGIAKGVEGQKTVFHELFHKGLNNLLPEADYKSLMDKFYSQSADVRAMADAYLASDTGKKDTAKLSKEAARTLAVEESLAEIAEQTKLKPTLVRQIGNFLANTADRFGMPQLARAIRTMGLNEQEKFIRDALQAGIKAGPGIGVTRFRTISPETEAAVSDVDVIGEQSEARSISGNPAIKARIRVANNMAGLFAKFDEWYGSAIRTGGNRLIPSIFLSRALDADRVSNEAQLIGGLKKADELIVAGEITDADGNQVLGADGKPLSYKNVLSRIAETARKEGKSYEQYKSIIDKVLYGHREYNIRENNRIIEQQVAALEAAGKKKEADKLREDIAVLAIKDDAKLDAIEAEFQNNEFIKNVSSDLDAIRFNFIDMLVDTGRITKDVAQEWKDNTGYIPFNRVQDYENAFDSEGSRVKGVGVTRNIKKFKGSTRQSTSVIDNFSKMLDWATGEAMRNEAKNRALADMVLMGAARPGSTVESDAPGGIVKTFENGVQKQYYVPDPMLFVGFTMHTPEMNRVIQAFNRYGTRVLRAGVTVMPPFAIKQVFDDITRAYTFEGVKDNATLVKNVLTNFPRNWVNEAFNKEVFKTPAGRTNVKDLRRLGVVASFDLSREGNLKNIEVEAKAKKESLFHTVLRVMEAGAKASDISVRQAIYDQVLKETGDRVQAESAAREIINFSYQGSESLVRNIASVVPFFNAYAQGMDKLAVAAAGRVVGKTPGAARSMFYTRMTVLTALGFAYALMMQDDEEYQALPDHTRDTNWIIPNAKIGGMAVGIPVPQDLAFFFKAIPERVVRYMKYQGTEEEQAAIDVLSKLAVRGYDVFSPPNVTPQLIRPLLENYVNYSFFLGRPLESQEQIASRRPFQRAGIGTSDAMKVVAEHLEYAANATGIEAFAISPIKLENAMRGLLGTTGGIVLSVADMMVNPDRTDRPLHQQLSTQLTGASALLKNAVGTRYMDEIYNLERRTEQVNSTYNTMLETQPEKASDFLAANIGMYSIRDAVKSAMDSIRSLNETAMAIDRDTSMSPEERRAAIDELRAEQNEIARVVFMLRRQAFETQRDN